MSIIKFSMNFFLASLLLLSSLAIADDVLSAGHKELCKKDVNFLRYKKIISKDKTKNLYCLSKFTFCNIKNSSDCYFSFQLMKKDKGKPPRVFRTYIKKGAPTIKKNISAQYKKIRAQFPTSLKPLIGAGTEISN